MLIAPHVTALTDNDNTSDRQQYINSTNKFSLYSMFIVTNYTYGSLWQPAMYTMYHSTNYTSVACGAMWQRIGAGGEERGRLRWGK